MSSTFDKVNGALSLIQDYPGALNDYQREIIADIQYVIDAWHDANHEAGDVLNRDSRVCEATALLDITLKHRDPIERSKAQQQYYRR